MGAMASAPIKRAQFAVEDTTEQGVIWPHLVPGKGNPADICTEDVGSTGGFQAKNGILYGSEPHLYGTGAVREILSGADISLQVFKKKKKKK